VFDRLGRLARDRFIWVILAWVAIAAIVHSVAPALADVATYDETAFLTADAESVRAADALLQGWPEDEFGNSAAIVVSHEPKLSDADFSYVDLLETWLRSDDAPKVVKGTQSVRTRPQLKDVLSAADGSTTLLIVQFTTPPFEPPTNDAVVDIRKHIRSTRPDGLAVHVTGNAGVAADQANSIDASVSRTTFITLILVIAILLWVYRSPVTLAVPLITIGTSLAVAQGLIALLAQAGMKVSSLVETFMVVIIFGAGTDYCLFVISRFREEVGHSREYRATLVATVAVVGAVIASSAGTVIVGFTAQGVAKFGMFRTVGPAMAVAVMVTLVAGLTLTPALMRAFGTKLFWPAHPEALAEAGALPELLVSKHLGLATPFAEAHPVTEEAPAFDEPAVHAPEPSTIDASDEAPSPIKRTAKSRAVAAKRPRAAVARRATTPKRKPARAAAAKKRTAAKRTTRPVAARSRKKRR